MNGKRILIFRPDNIGDVLLFTGALKHIRNLYPDGHITLAVQSHIVNLVELCPYIDTCISIDYLTWHGKIEQVKLPFKSRITQSIRTINRIWNIIRRPFDTIIYPVKSPQVFHLEIIHFLNAKTTFGITGCRLNEPEDGYPSKLQLSKLFTNYLDISRIDPWTHELITTLDFLLFMGCHITTIDDIKPQFWLADSEKNYLDNMQKNEQKIIGLFPGASREKRCWEPGNYGKLVKLMGGRPIYAIFGSSADKDLSDLVATSIGKHCRDVGILNLAGQTTLRELAKTIMSCDLLISMETSGLHMAITANVPTIGIVGGGHYGRFVPWGNPENNIFLTKKMECFNCNWLCPHEEAECIKGVSPQEVAIAAATLLQQHNLHVNNNER